MIDVYEGNDFVVIARCEAVNETLGRTGPDTTGPVRGFFSKSKLPNAACPHVSFSMIGTKTDKDGAWLLRLPAEVFTFDMMSGYFGFEQTFYLHVVQDTGTHSVAECQFKRIREAVVNS